VQAYGHGKGFTKILSSAIIPYMLTFVRDIIMAMIKIPAREFVVVRR